MANISENFKQFFDIRKLKHLYPNKNTNELELIQTYFCKTVLYHIHHLQGKINHTIETIIVIFNLMFL